MFGKDVDHRQDIFRSHCRRPGPGPPIIIITVDQLRPGFWKIHQISFPQIIWSRGDDPFVQHSLLGGDNPDVHIGKLNNDMMTLISTS